MLRRRFGAHLGTSDGIRYAAVNARALGVEAMQIMVGEGHSWSPFKMSDSVVNEFRKLAYGVAVYVHLPYTLNPCVGKGHQHYSIQRAVLRKYLDVCDAVGATAAVLHPGYKKELSDDAAKSNFIKFMEDCVPTMTDVKLLFETDSGSKNGSKIGSETFISDVLGQLPRAHFGMCVDTEHLYARGIDLWEQSIREEFLYNYGHLIDLVHLNAPDEGVELGSFVDKHSVELQSHFKNSDELVKDLVSRFPTVLERRSLVISERDVSYVNSLVPPGVSGMEKVTDEERVQDDPTNAGHFD